MKNHPLYELCYRAYYNISFTPDKRAESEIIYYENQIAEFNELLAGNEERTTDVCNKFTAKFKAHMMAKSRCLSSMITGPAKFPVARAEKASKREHVLGEEVLNFVAKIRKLIDKEKNPHKHSISSDAVNAIELLKDKLGKLKANHELMKEFNKIVRKKLTDEERLKQLIACTGKDAEFINKMLVPNVFGRIGFESFELTNNNATIKNTEARIKELEAKQGRETKETIIECVRVVENTEENRIQLFFDGKPEQKIITLLKSRGMKWSPRSGCWQRMLNNNGIYAVKQILKELKQ